MALGYWTDDGSKPGFGLLGEHPPFSWGQRKQEPRTKDLNSKLENDPTSFEMKSLAATERVCAPSLARKSRD